MELIYIENIGLSQYAMPIRDLLVLADKEFNPPLSTRGSTTQTDLSHPDSIAHGIQTYYEAMCRQPAIVALDSGRCMGFMAFKINYTCEQIREDQCPNLYASTCVVHPDARGKGLMTGFYQKMIELFPTHDIFTRTWHSNTSHLYVLSKLGFREFARLTDHRGKGMDTVYFCRTH